MTLVRLNRRPSGRGGAPPPPPTEGRLIVFPKGSWRMLHRYWLVAGSVLVVLTVVFAVVSAFGIPLLEDPAPRIAAAGSLAAVAVFGLLLGDVVLPVPSSLVMVASGMLFGPILGAALSLAGGLAGTAVAFELGRRGSPLLSRLVGTTERAAADMLVQRHGALAILVTRPVPLLAEATALLAGASNLPRQRALFAAGLGMLPAAALYAVVGWLALDFPAIVVVFVAVVLLGVVFWLVEKMRRPDKNLR